MDGASERVHATAIAIGAPGGFAAALIRGAPGSGKSDLALRCLGLGASPLVAGIARLVADDQVLLTRRAARLVATAPAAIRGLVEVRGLGIVPLASVDHAVVALVVDLVPRDAVPRLPDPPGRAVLLGLEVPRVALHAFDASAPLKVLLALQQAAAAASPSTQGPAPGGRADGGPWPRVREPDDGAL